MADGVVLFGVQKLWDLLIQEAERFTGIHERAAELRDEVGRLKGFLKDADAKKHGSERVRYCLEEINEIVFDAEDIIEAFLLKEGSVGGKGVRESLTRFTSNSMNRRKVDSQIKRITARISKVMESMQSLGIQDIVDNGNPPDSLFERLRKTRQSFPNESESDLVGLEESIQELTGHLVERGNNRVVLICGMGGIGKTTLARQVFHHDMVRSHFDKSAWVCVSKQCSRTLVWRDILLNLCPKDKENRFCEMSDEQLQDALFKLLETGKYLIVLDDLWSKEDWDLIKPVFTQKPGSKILLTSRNEDVASHADLRCKIFRPRCLTHEESWKLLQQISFSERDDIDFEMEEVKEEIERMIKHCGGLPLAVKTLGGLLSTKRTASEWKRVQEKIGSQIIRGISNDHNINKAFQVLSLSYEDLSFRLKHCFLYLSVFPEDHLINVETLFRYWAAEGIVQIPSEGTNSSVREVAEDYLAELVKRNMVLLSTGSDVSSRINTISLHDVMRDVCLMIAEEENFLEVVTTDTHFSSINYWAPIPRFRSHRLAVHQGLKFDGSEKGQRTFNARRIRNPRLRSLCRNCRRVDPWFSAPSFGRLPSLRVLDLDGVIFEGGKLSKSIGELIHLRYLSLYATNLTEVPSSLRNLTLLLFLDLGVYGEKIHVPNVLKRMNDLRYLRLPMDLSQETKLELGSLVKLETLINFSTKHCRVEDLLNMRTLRKLFINAYEKEEIILPLSLTDTLKLVEEFELSQRTRETAKFDAGAFIPGLVSLSHLTLTGTEMEKLPDQLRNAQLVSIRLWGCGIGEDPMPILEKMPKLKEVSLDLDSFVGRRMVCSRDGFPQLRNLEMTVLQNLEEWVVEQGSMPRLRRLSIRCCQKLESLPDGLRHITALKELLLVAMIKDFKDKLVEGGEDHYKFQHIPSIRFYSCDR